MSPLMGAVQSELVAESQSLLAQASESLKSLKGAEARARTANVKEFFEVLHTLKGTISMIEGAAGQMPAIERLEARLASRALVESAKDLTWVFEAAHLVTRMEVFLKKNKERNLSADSATSKPLFGFLVKSLAGKFVWIPMRSILRVMTWEFQPDLRGIFFKGRWIPILKQEEGKAPRYALILEVPSGTALVGVQAVLKPARRDELVDESVEIGAERLLY